MIKLEFFRKKPVVVMAVQWDGTLSHARHLEKGLGLKTLAMTSHPPTDGCSRWKIATLEDGHVVSPFDWIITNVKGEHYPCKPDVFALTYETAPPDAPQPDALAALPTDALAAPLPIKNHWDHLHAVADQKIKLFSDALEKRNSQSKIHVDDSNRTSIDGDVLILVLNKLRSSGNHSTANTLLKSVAKIN